MLMGHTVIASGVIKRQWQLVVRPDVHEAVPMTVCQGDCV